MNQTGQADESGIYWSLLDFMLGSVSLYLCVMSTLSIDIAWYWSTLSGVVVVVWFLLLKPAVHSLFHIHGGVPVLYQTHEQVLTYKNNEG